jgi:hypothetical protein
METKIVDVVAPFYIVDKNYNIDYCQYIKGTIPYIRDFIKVLEGDGASSYYSNVQHQTIQIEELEKLIIKLADVIYGK